MKHFILTDVTENNIIAIVVYDGNSQDLFMQAIEEHYCGQVPTYDHDALQMAINDGNSTFIFDYIEDGEERQAHVNIQVMIVYEPDTKKQLMIPAEPQKEKRVYLVGYGHEPDFDYDTAESLTDEQFMDKAEEQGNVYSLEGFQNAWNGNGTSDIEHQYTLIRII